MTRGDGRALNPLRAVRQKPLELAGSGVPVAVDGGEPPLDPPRRQRMPPLIELSKKRNPPANRQFSPCANKDETPPLLKEERKKKQTKTKP